MAEKELSQKHLFYIWKKKDWNKTEVLANFKFRKRRCNEMSPINYNEVEIACVNDNKIIRSQLFL